MSFDSFRTTVERELNPVDFAEGFYDSAIRQPVNGVKQLFGAKVTSGDAGHRPGQEVNKTLASAAGNLAGFIVDFTVLSKVTGTVVKNPMGNMFLAGGIHGGVFTPSSDKKGILSGRLENGLVSGSTFAVMGAVSKTLESEAMAKAAPLLTKVSTNAIAGGAGGVVEAYGRTYVDQNRLAKPNEVLSTIGQYALFGAGFGALNHGLTKGAEKVANVPALRDGYYRAKWALSDSQTEAQRTTYSVLNQLDLRHPVQRARNFLFGFNPEAGVVKPRLTAENNPITAFENELPQYFRTISQMEEKIADLPRNSAERYAIYEHQKEIRKDFAYKLVKWWHGSEKEPGIAQFTDAQLATANASVERIAQVRKAFMSSGKSDYPNPSALSQALADLSPVKVELKGSHDAYDLVDGLGSGKARFFGYDEGELVKRMSMPSIFHAMDHHYRTPVGWLPFEATDKLPNLFHGSISHSLPSLFTERTMFSARELRLRGISQVAGESATEEFPRRAVSLTKDWNEAWAYHRHSPDNLTSFPVVFGASAEVLPRAYPAGALEPGEILIDKLRLGNSPMTKLGLRKPEITHIFVPDGQVGAVSRQLAAHRLSGINVVGLSEMPRPRWKPEPTEQELQGMYGY